MNKKTYTILGIDPGTNVMGYGLLKVNNNKTAVITIGVITTVKFSTHYDKLKYIFTRILAVIDEYKPDEVALEAPFFGKNVQSKNP